jgi:hypothetical protein
VQEEEGYRNEHNYDIRVKQPTIVCAHTASPDAQGALADNAASTSSNMRGNGGGYQTALTRFRQFRNRVREGINATALSRLEVSSLWRY